MKKIPLKFVWAVLVYCLCFINGFSQNNHLNYAIKQNSAISSEKKLPFWMTANTFGTVPNSHYGLIYAAVFSDFKQRESNFSFSYKANVTAYSASKNALFINELFGSFKFKGAQLDVGSKNNAVNWEGLSSTNGNIVKSVNTRAFPGINLKTVGYLKLPFAQNWLSVKANYGEYLLIDKRAVTNAHLHHKSLYFNSVLSKKISIITGMDHYVQWAGTSQKFGKQPSAFKDYLKMFSGNSGDENAAEGDQINALGNTVGAYLFQLNYTGEKTSWDIYWSHPFEDRSGRELTNYPDALYGIFIDLRKPKSFITHFLTEFTYTKNMSGKSGISGRDNYFNNGIYNSGWTYFGRTIGSPFFRTKEPVDGITSGIDQNYSRFAAYHVGFKGFLTETIRYKTYFSYVYFPGWFDDSINEKQFSVYVAFYLQPKKIPFEITIGTAADFGSALSQNFGVFLKFTKNVRAK